MNRVTSGKLGRWQALSLAISFVVGAGILILPVLSLEIAGPVTSLHAWILMTLVGLPLVMIFYKISINRRLTLAEYFSEAFGEGVSQGARITVLLALVLGMPAMIYSAASLFVHLFRIHIIGPSLLSHLILTALCLNHLRPLEKSSKISLYSAILLLLLIAGSVLWNLDKLFLGFNITVHSLPQLNRPLFQACTLTFFGFVGWESLSFFSDGLQNPKRDLKWIYGGSFALISISYLALSGAITGLSLEGHQFGIQEGFLSMLPVGVIRTSSLVVTGLFLLANLNAWVLPGFKQIQEITIRQPSKKIALLYYYVIISSILLLLETKIISLSTLLLLSNQNWVVIYGGVLAYYFKYFRTRTDRAIGLVGGLSFFLLLSGCSVLILANLALFYFLKKSVVTSKQISTQSAFS